MITSVPLAPHCDVFVYGTLRHGEINDIALVAARFGRPDLPPPRHLATGRVMGHLVDFGAWPGLVPAPRSVAHDGHGGGRRGECLPSYPDGWVTGDVFRIDAALLPILDEIEGIRPDGREAFYRGTITVRDVQWCEDVTPAADADGARPTQAVCFYYPIDESAAHGLPVIRGGDWIAYRMAYRRSRAARR